MRDNSPSRASTTYFLPAYFSYAVPAAVLIIFAIGAFILYESNFRREASRLKKTALSLAQGVPPDGYSSEFLSRLGRDFDIRIDWLTPDGAIQSASQENLQPTHRYSFYKDVRAALSGGEGEFEGAYPGQEEKRYFVSMPVIRDGKIDGIVRVSRAMKEINHGLASTYAVLALALLFFTFLPFLFFRYIQKEIGLPLENIKTGIRRFTEGNLGARLPAPECDDLAELVININSMAASFENRLRQLSDQYNNLESVVRSLREGILVIDFNERVVKINSAAYEMLGTVTAVPEGKPLQEVVRNVNLQRFILDSLAGCHAQEAEISLHESREMIVQVYSSIILGESGEAAAVMIVVSDTTHLKLLENVRRDFVANVSHELKTPITSIQGFIETLLDGAVDNPADNRRFLGIIHKQTERLNNIFNDLLLLADLERESGERAFRSETLHLPELVESSIQLCHIAAAAKGITFDLTGVLPVRGLMGSASLLEQALVNLASNAIKYGPPHSSVRITSTVEGEKVRISVIDEGPGIEKRYLARLFERFYRVDPSRSRAEGGTGLGLSIVKHIAALHEGSVDVESEPGKGSIFSLLLPLSQN